MTWTWTPPPAIGCEDVLAFLRRVPTGSVDMILTDPPYGLSFLGSAWDDPETIGNWRSPDLEKTREAYADEAYGGEGLSARLSRGANYPGKPKPRVHKTDGSTPTGYGFSGGSWRIEGPQYGASRNPNCRACRKSMRGKDSCACATPESDAPDRNIEAFRAFSEWCTAWARECLRVLRPGSYCAVFGGCYDSKTEVLTRRGWIAFPEATDGDEFASLDPVTQQVEWLRPKRLIREPYDGPMIHFKTGRVDLLVTPDHNMYVRRRSKQKFELVPAKECPTQFKVQKHSAGLSDFSKPMAGFLLPSQTVGTSHGHFRELPAMHIPWEVWLPFFGLWLAQGYASRIRCNGGVSNSIGVVHPVVADVQAIMRLLSPYFNARWNAKSGRILINDKRLCMYLRQFGKAPDKYVPAEIKALPPEDIRLFLEWYRRGDGDRTEDRFRLYTSSKQLADDVQECALYAGWAADIVTRPPRSGAVYKGRTITGHHPSYVISVLRCQITPEVCNRNNRRPRSVVAPVRRMVYCVELPKNHTLYVRRNGKAVWCGNSRTWDALAWGIRMAGFEIRDTVTIPAVALWVQGQGMAKGLNVARALDGADAARWGGHNTNLRPAVEFVVMARAPFPKGLIANLRQHGTGALHVDAVRIPATGPAPGWHKTGTVGTPATKGFVGKDNFALHERTPEEIQAGTAERMERLGRWPANLILAHSDRCQYRGTQTVIGDPRQTGNGRRPGGFLQPGAPKGDGEPNARVYGDAEVPVYDCAPGCPVAAAEAAWPVTKSGTMKGGTQRKKSRGKGGYGDGFPDEATRADTRGDAGSATRFFLLPEDFRPPESADAAAASVGYYTPKVAPRDRRLPGYMMAVPETKHTRSDGTPAVDEAIAETLCRKWRIPQGVGESWLQTLAGWPIPEAVVEAEPDDVRARFQPAASIHPTHKPVKVLRWLLRLASPDPKTVGRPVVVLDPFVGSGSTAIAAAAEGRVAVVNDFTPKYTAIAAARLEGLGVEPHAVECLVAPLPREWGGDAVVAAAERPQPEERTCPRCGVRGEIDTLFGWRRMSKGGPVRPQAWCKPCRGNRPQAVPADA